MSAVMMMTCWFSVAFALKSHISFSLVSAFVKAKQSCCCCTDMSVLFLLRQLQQSPSGNLHKLSCNGPPSWSGVSCQLFSQGVWTLELAPLPLHPSASKAEKCFQMKSLSLSPLGFLLQAGVNAETEGEREKGGRGLIPNDKSCSCPLFLHPLPRWESIFCSVNLKVFQALRRGRLCKERGWPNLGLKEEKHPNIHRNNEKDGFFSLFLPFFPLPEAEADCCQQPHPSWLTPLLMEHS